MCTIRRSGKRTAPESFFFFFFFLIFHIFRLLLNLFDFSYIHEVYLTWNYEVNMINNFKSGKYDQQFQVFKEIR